MSDLLAIVDSTQTDEELVAEIIRRHPDRVTVLVEAVDLASGSAQSPQEPAPLDRVVKLIAAIEARTGAVVVGLAGSRDQLLGWRFDRIVGGRAAQPAV
jgi:hypothetical protein